MTELIYIPLEGEAILPACNMTVPFKAIICIEDDVTPEWRLKVSKWIVDAGCLYALCWGKDCALWDDSIDSENLEAHDWRLPPNDKNVVTTWHDNESISEVIWFSLNAAQHPVREISQTVFLHIGQMTTRVEIESTWKRAVAERA